CKLLINERDADPGQRQIGNFRALIIASDSPPPSAGVEKGFGQPPVARIGPGYEMENEVALRAPICPRLVVAGPRRNRRYGRIGRAMPQVDDAAIVDLTVRHPVHFEGLVAPRPLLHSELMPCMMQPAVMRFDALALLPCGAPVALLPEPGPCLDRIRAQVRGERIELRSFANRSYIGKQ